MLFDITVESYFEKLFELNDFATPSKKLICFLSLNFCQDIITGLYFDQAPPRKKSRLEHLEKFVSTMYCMERPRDDLQRDEVTDCLPTVCSGS